jgi:hypothetical protein
MAFPDVTTLLSDFSSAPSWTGHIYTSGDFGLSVSGGKLSQAGTWGNQAYPGSFGPNVNLYSLIDTPGTGFLLHVRLVNPATAGVTGYAMGQLSTNAAIIRIDNSTTFVTLASQAGPTWATGDSIGVSAVGSALSLWRKPAAGSWGQVVAASDSTYSTAGQFGIEIQDLWVLEDLRGGTVSASDALQGSSDVHSGSSDILSGPRDVLSGSSDTF